MNIIYESDCKTSYYEEDLSLITNVWTNKDMANEEFQKEILIWVELVEKYKPKNLIADLTNFIFTINIELQDWTGNEVFPRLTAAGARKFAIIVSQEIVSQLSVEQTMDEANPSKLRSNYFASIDEAKKWFVK